MPRLSNLDRVRAILCRDPVWGAYALGDLAPPHSEYAEWYADSAGTALILLYRGLGATVLALFGEPAELEPLLDELPPEPEVFVNVCPDALPLVYARFDAPDLAPMWRMLLVDWEPVPAPPPAARLGMGDLEALTALYAHRAGREEDSAFFLPEMLEIGVYYGIWEGDALVAAAGTHLVTPAEGVAAIGNVYTRPDRRGRGLATAVTGAVAAELVAAGTETIVLNVDRRNAAAVRVYERLGFRAACPFFEGFARRR